jgi:hypothetical protein
MNHTRTIYVSDDFYGPKMLAAEMFDRLTDGSGIAYTKKSEAKENTVGDAKVCKYRVHISFERLPA